MYPLRPLYVVRMSPWYPPGDSIWCIEALIAPLPLPYESPTSYQEGGRDPFVLLKGENPIQTRQWKTSHQLLGPIHEHVGPAHDPGMPSRCSISAGHPRATPPPGTWGVVWAGPIQTFHPLRPPIPPSYPPRHAHRPLEHPYVMPIGPSYPPRHAHRPLEHPYVMPIGPYIPPNLPLMTPIWSL